MRRFMVVAAVTAAAMGAIIAGGGGGGGTGTCNLNATTANFATQAAAASSGQTVCVAAGTYSLNNFAHTGQVNVTPQSGVAESAVKFNLSGLTTHGISLDGVTVTDMDMSSNDGGTYHDIGVKNSNFTGQSIFRNCGAGNTNLLYDHDVLNGIQGSQAAEGRLHFPVEGTGNCGFTIQNSELGGGCSDGIQTGALGIHVVNNYFHDIVQACSPDGALHVDALQFDGGDHSIVTGNFFWQVEDCIMAPDGTISETITDNVCVTHANNDGQYGFTLGPDTGSDIEHNTLINLFGGGAIRIYGGNAGGQSRNTIVKNNITYPDGGDFSSTGGTNNYNLCSASGACGSPNSVHGIPLFVGGTVGSPPSTYAGYKLAAGSPGVGVASDGANMGARVP